jgi:hypothetical protein
MTEKAFQDNYSDALSVCYGCGRLNPHGLKSKVTGKATPRYAGSCLSRTTPLYRDMSMGA